MFDMNLKPIPGMSAPESRNPTNSRLNSPPSIQYTGTSPQMFTPVQSFQGFVYGSEQVTHSKDTNSKENYLSTIQSLGSSPQEIADTLKKSGYAWTNSESTTLPIFSIGVNKQAEQKTDDYAYLLMGNPDNNSMYSVTTFRLTNGDLLTKIETALTGSDVFTVQMVKVGNNGYQVNTPLAPQGQYIPIDTPLDAVNFAIASIWVGAMSVVGKHIDSSALPTENSKQSKVTVDSTKDKKKDEILGDEVMCTEHDMGCSGGLATPDGKLNFWFPCAGSFSVDVYDCCYKHDVDIYCSTSYGDALSKDYDVVNCIHAKIIEAGFEAMSWTCIWVFGPLLLAFFTVTSIIGYIGALIWDYKSELVNYNGSHKDSCLCGGTKPTECCDSDKVRSICLDKDCKKVDLCKAKGKRINNPQCNPQKKCFNCFWKCLYSDQGDYLGKEYVRDPAKKLPCCGSIQPKGGLQCPV